MQLGRRIELTAHLVYSIQLQVMRVVYLLEKSTQNVWTNQVPYLVQFEPWLTQ